MVCVLCSSEVDPLFNYFCHYEKASWILSLKRPGQSRREVHQSSWVTEGEGGSCLPTTFSSLGSVLLKLFVSPSSCPPPLRWSVNVVPSLTELSPAFPLHMGTQFSLLLKFYCGMSSHPASAQVFGAGYFFILFPPWQIQLQKSI